ncbi:PEP-CTERM sorting domain-containing protein [Pelotalea chapellei]|uniref:PEP-CTERM sorting domain-containing protein n=1 Tax=Pelotalea chapellei TaxID=44671 RepID=A0ABS5U6G6_9BACT|nr:PEP-CTERM sorting domain-containing protein [Pelotalea chapellei]MBT1071260.1 PEP-CTERM sorting domain-containing protein [Pelotalea chapellei]
MKKACAAVGFGAVIAFSGLAGATTWTDTVGESGSATHTFNNGHPTYAYTYDITNINNIVDGNKAFLPGADSISSAELVLHFKNIDSRDSAEIKIGNFTTTITNSEEARVQLPSSVLNEFSGSGMLPVSITATNVNSFRLEDSILNVKGNEFSSAPNGTGQTTFTGNGTAPVPEPSAFILLSVCLGGLALLRKRATS